MSFFTRVLKSFPLALRVFYAALSKGVKGMEPGPSRYGRAAYTSRELEDFAARNLSPFS